MQLSSEMKGPLAGRCRCELLYSRLRRGAQVEVEIEIEMPGTVPLNCTNRLTTFVPPVTGIIPSLRDQ